MKKTVAILGIGATGSILGAYLGNTKVKLILKEKFNRLKQLQTDGINVTGFLKKSHRDFTIIDSVDQLKNTKIDALFICTKTTLLSTVLSRLKDNITSETILISFQNGIGPEDEIEKYFPHNPIARVVLNFAGNIDMESGIVNMTWFHPPNILGPHANCNATDLTWLVDLLNQSELTTQLVNKNELKKSVFIKTTLNAALAPYCSIANLTMSEAMKTPSRSLICQILNECLAVGRALGYQFDENAIEQYLLNYLAKGGNHYPSMWGDLHHKRLSEIDYINGKILEISYRLKLHLPMNQMITNMVMAQEIKNGLRKEENLPAYLFQTCFQECGANTDASEARRGCMKELYQGPYTDESNSKK